MSMILATVLVWLNALLGFVVILSSIAFAKFAYEEAYRTAIAFNLFSQEGLFIVGLPVLGLCLAAYLCGMIALLGLMESHLKVIREQVEYGRGLPSKGRTEPNLPV